MHQIGRTSTTSAAFLIALVLGALLACKKGDGEECQRTTDCKSELICLSPPGSSGGKCMTMTKANAECEANDYCKSSGFCIALSMGKPGEVPMYCGAGLDQHCAKAKVCAEKGLCKVDDATKKCVAGGSAPSAPGAPAGGAKDDDKGW